MNFASKLMASAEKAAEAAKNFKGFDEMADEDDYIHSEGLNVKASSPIDVESPREETHSVADSNISAEPTWSLLDRPAVASISQSGGPDLAASASRGRSMSRNESTISSASPASSISPPPRQRPAPKPRKFFGTQPTPVVATQQPPPPPPQRSAMPLLSVVADALESGSMSESGRQRHQSSFSGYDTDNEESSVNQHGSSSSSSSDESDDEDDAILSQIRQSKSGSSSRGRKQQLNQKKGKKKNPNRFMEELNQRGSVPIPGSASAAEFAQKQQTAMEIENKNNSNDNATAGNGSDAGGGRLSNLKNWINPFQRNSPNSVVSQAASLLKKGPLSRRDAPPAAPAEQQNEEEFQILAGSSVLSDDELEALAQMNSQSQRSIFSPIALVQLIRKHPREAFIVFTMLLAIFVFFFTRKTSNEDDVQ